MALSDPPRSDVVGTIEHCHSAGVDVVMVTGDQAPTAELQALLDGGEEGASKLRRTHV
ncbi:MAG: hypothetical protein JRG93_16250, partial [Deltaproteobacteria bacterium]|nr:hypothetical protein [Deltaproteobacteria bacterium]